MTYLSFGLFHCGDMTNCLFGHWQLKSTRKSCNQAAKTSHYCFGLQQTVEINHFEKQ